MENTFLKTIQCKRCHEIFFVCNHCWRGQAYCCDKCRQAAHREAHNKRQRKYRQTPKGRQAHCRQEKNRRLRKTKKTMDDASSTLPVQHDNDPVERLFCPPCCRFCGRQGTIVDGFPRRGYGGRYAEPIIIPKYLKGG